jgi:nucleoside-diphosphate-sugar epimerase
VAKVLILGGTRNLGHATALALLERGDEVTILNRGITPDDLPLEIERIHTSRHDPSAVAAATKKRRWDAVVDTTSYTAADAASVAELFRDQCDKIVFTSTGQVYLVRSGVHAPFTEADYEGPVIPEPPGGTSDHDNWRYGVDKRAAERVFNDISQQIPVVSLRLPMIASERDHYGRIQGYIARMQDGGPILIPSDSSLPIRHVYVEDAARIIAMLCTEAIAGYRALNISYGESISLTEFLEILESQVGISPRVLPVARSLLESAELLPHCSAYSGKWMSELDNSLGVRTLQVSYTAPREYVNRIVSDYEGRWKPNSLTIPGYERRAEELELVKKLR